MILYFAGTFILGIFIGISWRNSQVVRAAKNGTVITVDGIIYMIKRVTDTLGGSVER